MKNFEKISKRWQKLRYRNLWADLSQGMANSQMEPWNNLWADLSQGMANSH